MIHREFKVIEASSSKELEEQVRSHAEKKDMVPFSVSVLRTEADHKSQRYKAFVVFEAQDMRAPGKNN